MKTLFEYEALRDAVHAKLTAFEDKADEFLTDEEADQLDILDADFVWLSFIVDDYKQLLESIDRYEVRHAQRSE